MAVEGEEAVEGVLKKFKESGFEANEVVLQFLQRIARVESNCGKNPQTYRSGYHGGICQVDRKGFEDTQDVKSHPGLVKKHGVIKEKFGIEWMKVSWEDLRKPFYSVLAARLFLSNIREKIPDDLDGQAEYWKKYYNTEKGAGTKEKFKERAERS